MFAYMHSCGNLSDHSTNDGQGLHDNIQDEMLVEQGWPASIEAVLIPGPWDEIFSFLT